MQRASSHRTGSLAQEQLCPVIPMENQSASSYLPPCGCFHCLVGEHSREGINSKEKNKGLLQIIQGPHQCSELYSQQQQSDFIPTQ